MKTIKGLIGKNIDQLIEFTNNDESVKKFTSDLKRFSNRETLKGWLKKGRKIYCLIDDNDDLMGISWFGLEGQGFTLAVRMYGNARGMGLSKNFLNQTMSDFMNEPEYISATNKNWWLEVSKENMPAIKIYEQLGFIKMHDGTTSDKVIYGKR